MERDAPTPCWGTVRDSTNSSGLFCSFFNSFFWPTLTPRRDFKKATKLGSASIDKERDREVIESLKILDNAYRSCYLSWSFHSHSTYPLLLCQLSFLFKLRHLTALWPPEHVNWGQLSGEVTPEREMINVFQGKAAKKKSVYSSDLQTKPELFLSPSLLLKKAQPYKTIRYRENSGLWFMGGSQVWQFAYPVCELFSSECYESTQNRHHKKNYLLYWIALELQCTVYILS